jgi:hypothetical protein
MSGETLSAYSSPYAVNLAAHQFPEYDTSVLGVEEK